MDLETFFQVLDKRLESFNTEIRFAPVKENGIKANEISIFTDEDLKYVRYGGEHGSYKVVLNPGANILTLECSGDNSDQAEYKEILKSLFDLSDIEERDIKSTVNELVEELAPLYKAAKKDLSAVKLPKSASKSAVKNGIVSYTETDLATRFADQYNLKDEAKGIVLEYGELLPETFFIEYGTPLVMEALRNKDDLKLKKMFKLLNDVYENGTNSAQDIIAVTILGEMKNDPQLLETADQYMCEYMNGPVHQVNKIIGKKSLQKKLKTPPPYKPKKKKKPSMMSSLMQGGQPQ